MSSSENNETSVAEQLDGTVESVKRVSEMYQKAKCLVYTLEHQGHVTVNSNSRSFTVTVTASTPSVTEELVELAKLGKFDEDIVYDHEDDVYKVEKQLKPRW